MRLLTFICAGTTLLVAAANVRANKFILVAAVYKTIKFKAKFLANMHSLYE